MLLLKLYCKQPFHSVHPFLLHLLIIFLSFNTFVFSYILIPLILSLIYSFISSVFFFLFIFVPEETDGIPNASLHKHVLALMKEKSRELPSNRTGLSEFYFLFSWFLFSKEPFTVPSDLERKPGLCHPRSFVVSGSS